MSGLAVVLRSPGCCWLLAPAPALQVAALPGARPASGTTLLELVCCGGECCDVGWLVLVLVVAVGGGVVVAMLGQVMVLSLALVVVHVDVMKHSLSATFAPMSVEYGRGRVMALTIVEACLIRLAYRKRSSASTLGSILCDLMVEIHGFINRATKAMEKGQPCGIEHRCW